MENYEGFINSISKSSGLEKQEIEKRVNAKQEKISGLISTEGAAQIVAAELGINLDDEKFKIEELSSSSTSSSSSTCCSTCSSSTCSGPSFNSFSPCSRTRSSSSCSCSSSICQQLIYNYDNRL